MTRKITYITCMYGKLVGRSADAKNRGESVS